MTRRAVEAFLEANPNSLPTSANAPPEQISDNASDAHPYNRPLQIAYVGSLAVFTWLDDPAKYYLDMNGRVRASEQQARAAFGADAIAQHRRLAEDLAVDKRIAQAVDEAVRERDGVKTPQELRAEKLAELRARAARAIKEHEKKTQAAADKQLTSWLDKEPPPPQG